MKWVRLENKGKDIRYSIFLTGREQVNIPFTIIYEGEGGDMESYHECQFRGGGGDWGDDMMPRNGMVYVT